MMAFVCGSYFRQYLFFSRMEEMAPRTTNSRISWTGEVRRLVGLLFLEHSAYGGVRKLFKCGGSSELLWTACVEMAVAFMPFKLFITYSYTWRRYYEGQDHCGWRKQTYGSACSSNSSAARLDETERISKQMQVIRPFEPFDRHKTGCGVRRVEVFHLMTTGEFHRLASRCAFTM